MDTDYLNAVDISGIEPELPHNPRSFKQVYIQDNLYIPHTKPGIGRLLRVSAEIKVLYTNMVLSPKTHSYGGQRLTGISLVVEGQARLDIQYAADDALQAIAGVEYFIPFSGCIAMDDDFDSDTEAVVTPYIEDIHVRPISSRKIFGSVLLLLNAEPFKVYR